MEKLYKILKALLRDIGSSDRTNSTYCTSVQLDSLTGLEPYVLGEVLLSVDVHAFHVEAVPPVGFQPAQHERPLPGQERGQQQTVGSGVVAAVVGGVDDVAGGHAVFVVQGDVPVQDDCVA